MNKLKEAINLISMLLADARVTGGGLCSPEYVREAKDALTRALTEAEIEKSELLKALENIRCRGCGIKMSGPETGCLDCSSTRVAIAKARGEA